MSEDNAVTKIALTACVSIILTGAAAWFAFGRDLTSRPEVEAIVSRNNSTIELRISASAVQMSELKGSVTKLVEAQQALVVEQRVLIERFNMLMDRMPK